MQKKKGWGGARPNSGPRPRHGEPTLRRSIRVPTSLDNKLKAGAKGRGISQAEYTIEILAAYFSDQ